MKKNIYILIILFSSGFSVFHSQNIDKKDINLSINDFPQEKIFVHFNSTFLVSGENLFYKIYCLNANTNKFSNLSKIAYVELINSDKSTVLKHKISLKSGLGKGDFFINTSIPSGNYKLIAYTQWMRNGGENTFFQNDITIINPFRANKKLKVKTSEHKEAIKNENDDDDIKISKSPIKSEFLEVNTNKQSFINREKVVLTIKGLKGKLSHGNYSISVKKIDSVNAPNMINFTSFSNKRQLNKVTKDSILFLPELRGELLTGRVYFKDSNIPKSNIKVGLSIPGKEYIFKIATTNKSGMFYFNVHEKHEYPNAIVQVMDVKRDGYRIELDNYKSPKFDDLSFNDFELSPSLNNLILQKSISNQIENAYHSIKNDSIIPVKSKPLFYKSKEIKYFLNDYTRFKTLKKTITEVIDAAYVAQKNDEYTFHIKFYNQITKSDLLPLVLIDGVPIQNHNDIIDYDAKNIKSINLVRSRYNYGGQFFMGIISIETIEGDYKHFSTDSYIKYFELEKPQVNKNYFKQVYDNNVDLKRIPDFRTQLFWFPNFKFNTDEIQFYFYTSDYIGEYEICIEGFTNNGNPVSSRKIISLKNSF